MTSLFHVSAALHSGETLFQLCPPIPFLFQISDPSALQQPGLVDKSGASQETRKGPFVRDVLGGITDCMKNTSREVECWEWEGLSREGHGNVEEASGWKWGGG